MLRTDFLQEVAHTRATQRLNESTQNNDASLQFAWETIQEQKKEIVRLRADNQELRTRKPVMESPSRFASSLFNEEPVKTINLLRSQLSSHHDTNLNILHDYITRLEDALRRASATDRGRDGRDALSITFDSSRGEEKENWIPVFSSSMVREDFARTQPTGRRSCDRCKRNSVSVVALQTEVKQLRVQASADEESLVRAEKEQLHLKRENSALTSTLMSAKQQQEDLRQMILDITHEKHQLQSLSESEQRASERSIRLLKDQLESLDDRNKQQTRKLERLDQELANACNEKRSVESKYSTLAGDYDKISETNTALRERVSRLQREVDGFEAKARQSAQVISKLQLSVETLRGENKRHGSEHEVGTQEKDERIIQAEKALATLEMQASEYQQRRANLESHVDRLQQTIQERELAVVEYEKTVAELKRDKQLLASLQKVEREKSLLQQDELDQAQEQVALQTERLRVALSECRELKDLVRTEKRRAETLKKRCEDADSTARERDDDVARLRQDLKHSEERKQTLEDHVNAQLRKEVDNFQTVDVEQSEDLESRNAQMSQEIADSKTTILMWMSKFNAVSEEVHRLEEDALRFAEERHSLQRQIEGMQVEHSEKLHEVERASEAKAAAQMSAVREQASEELQLAKQDITSQFESKIAALEKVSQDRQLQACSLKAELVQSNTDASKKTEELTVLHETLLDLENQVGILKDANRRLQYELRAEERQRKTLGMLVQTLQERPVLQKRAFQEMLLSSQRQMEFAFDQLSNRVEKADQKLYAAENRCKDLRMRLCRQKRDRKSQQQRGRFASQRKQLHTQAQDLDAVWREKLAQSRLRFKWHTLRYRLEKQHLIKSSVSIVLRALRQEQRCQQLQKLCGFTSWRYETKIRRLEQELASLEEKTATLSPVSTVALGNCVRLLQRFCEDTDTPADVGKSRETLVKYLIESNSKVAGWKRTIDRKIGEFSDRKEQLGRLQDRCSEMKELVALNQRLIGELERKAASQQAIVDAACSFTRAYKTLRSSVSAQMFKTDEFYSACKRIVEVVHATNVHSIRSGIDASKPVGVVFEAQVTRAARLAPVDETSELSSSGAAVSFAVTDGGVAETHDARRKQLNDSNIAILERAVGSLKDANEIRGILEAALAEKTNALAKVTVELERKSVQFVILRSFLRWKCSAYALRLQEEAATSIQ